MGDRTQFCMPRVREAKNSDPSTGIRLPGADPSCTREMRLGIARLHVIERQPG